MEMKKFLQIHFDNEKTRGKESKIAHAATFTSFWTSGKFKQKPI
jgi:hypothetical protein